MNGQPIRNAALAIAILESGPNHGTLIANSVPGFEGTSDAELKHASWLQTIRSNRDGLLRLNGFSGRHGTIQLMIRLNDEPRVYVSNPVELHPLFGEFRCELTGDSGESGIGVAKLSLDTTGREWADWLLVIWRRGFGWALLVTLGIEITIALTWAVWRGASVPRLLLRCVLGNLLTLPCVWITTLVAFALTANIPVGLTVLGLAELGALGIEALTYAWGRAATGRDLPKRGFAQLDAVVLSTAANVSSFVAGAAWALLGN